MKEEENIQENPEQNQPAEASSFRLIATLGLAGLFSGLILVVVYLLTLPIIEANKAEALQKAIFKVLPYCQSFKTLQLRDGKLVLKSDESSEVDKSNEETKNIFIGYDQSGQLIGFAIPASEPGFQDLISALFGYNATEETIIGFEVLESKETPGLGDKIMKDVNFRENFIALKVNPELVAVKPGKKQNMNEIELITGATISSKAVVRLLQKGIEEWRVAIEDFIKSNDIEVKEASYEAN